MTHIALVSPEDQRVTFVELFFDLVFVFSLTQVVTYLAHHLTWVGLGQAILVFWLVWWAWTQFTWALNAANTEHPGVELCTLGTTGIAFLMAVSLPEAFGGRALWFAVPYVLVRVLGLVIYARVAQANAPTHHAAVLRFAFPSTAGLAAVLLGAFVGGPAQYWLWLLTIVLDVIAAAIGGGAEDWNIHPEHFVERHGLFVIIALGETLIVAAAGLTTPDWSPELAEVAVLAVALSCALWWSYFTGPKTALEHGLAATSPSRRGAIARDAFSLLHFPMLCGIIGFAVAVEAAVAEPSTPFPTGARLALAASVVLFVGGTALAVRTCGGRLLGSRLFVGGLGAAALLGPWGLSPAAALAIALASVAVIVIVEGRPRSHAGELAQTRPPQHASD
jgi:low temperature requirement protein LtrA